MGFFSPENRLIFHFIRKAEQSAEGLMFSGFSSRIAGNGWGCVARPTFGTGY
jgi:hypothetical protein